jgi:hypothetical protein
VPLDLVEGMTNPVKDRHVLAAAVAARAEAIVTLNLRDFPRHAVRPWGIEILPPDVFLNQLFDGAKALILQILSDQAASLTRRPMTVIGVIRKLALQCPSFANRLAEAVA